MTLHREHEHTPGKRSPRHLANPDESGDRQRKHEDTRHHPAASRPEPGPPHKAVPRPVLSKHHPHTEPAEFALDADHGTHTDRPRPGKLAKKEKFRI